MMNTQITHRPFAATAIIAVISTSCGAQFGTVNTGPTKTLRVNIPYPELVEDAWRMSFTPGAARVRVTPGGEGTTPVNLQNDWTRSADTYDLPGRANAFGPTVTICATLGVSSLRLR